MYPVSEEYKSAIERGAVQHIRGVLRDALGRETELDDTNMVGTPSIDRRCVEDEEVFMTGQMYTGELTMSVSMAELRRDELPGGEIELYFSVDGADDVVPLGVWDISSAERGSGDILQIKALDHIDRLSAVIEDTTVGAIFMSAAMDMVEKVSGVQFAQTIDEINELMPTDSRGNKLDVKYGIFASHFLPTCRDEVRAIAQLIGGFAFANREGKIELRRFGKTPVRTVDAALRKSARLSESHYAVKAFSYTDSMGRTVREPCNFGSATTVLAIADNKYIQTSADSYKEFYDRLLYPLCTYFLGLKWVPGTIEYYGDPALDPGDMISLTGGISGSCAFLICSDYWQFRAPQQLTAPGAPQAGGSTVSSVGGASYASAAQSEKSSRIEVITLNEYPQTADISTTAADCSLGVTRGSWAFVHYSFQLISEGDSVVSVSAYIDGEEAELPTLLTLRDGEYFTAEGTIPAELSAGLHDISIELDTGHVPLRDSVGTALLDSEGTRLYPRSQNAEITLCGVSAHVWGQEISIDEEGGTGVSYVSEELMELTGLSADSTLRTLLTELDSQRSLLAENLTVKGVEADSDEPYSSLVARVMEIGTGGNAAMPAYVSATGNTGVFGNAVIMED